MLNGAAETDSVINRIPLNHIAKTAEAIDTDIQNYIYHLCRLSGGHSNPYHVSLLYTVNFFTEFRVRIVVASKNSV